VHQQRLRAVASGDRGDRDRGDTRTNEFSPPAVVPVEVHGIGAETQLDAGETTPPDGGQLAIGPGAPDEAKRGDQPIALATVLPALRVISRATFSTRRPHHRTRLLDT
jgi:hypothetical protein